MTCLGQLYLNQPDSALLSKEKYTNQKEASLGRNLNIKNSSSLSSNVQRRVSSLKRYNNQDMFFLDAFKHRFFPCPFLLYYFMRYQNIQVKFCSSSSHRSRACWKKKRKSNSQRTGFRYFGIILGFTVMDCQLTGTATDIRSIIFVSNFVVSEFARLKCIYTLCCALS